MPSCAVMRQIKIIFINTQHNNKHMSSNKGSISSPFFPLLANEMPDEICAFVYYSPACNERLFCVFAEVIIIIFIRLNSHSVVFSYL